MTTQINRLSATGVSIQNAGNPLRTFAEALQPALTFITEHQRRRAEQRVRPFLARQSDKALAQLGYSVDEIAEIRSVATR